MEKQFNKISTAEMKKNMSEDTMTICECCEFSEQVLDDIQILALALDGLSKKREK